MSTTTLVAKSEVNYLEKEEKESRASFSASSVNTIYTLNDQPFNPDKTLLIHAQGIRALRLPLPSRELEIAITHPDGHLAFLSTRDRICSGNSVLSSPKLGDLIRTEYFFGPNRDPVLHLLQPTEPCHEEIHLRGEWTSRAVRFVSPSGSKLRWYYAREKHPDGRKVNLIILSAVADANGAREKSMQTPQRLAQLSRCDETRTPQTSRCHAGNGGALQMDSEALRAHGVDESVVVATCMVMLKKEIDRRRLVQMMVIAGAAS